MIKNYQIYLQGKINGWPTKQFKDLLMEMNIINIFLALFAPPTLLLEEVEVERGEIWSIYFINKN